MSDQEPLANPEERNRIRLAGCVIADGDGKILLLHRNRENSVQWELPGGKFDPKQDKDLRDIAVREAWEELGVEVEIIGKMGLDSFEERGDTLDYTWYWAKIIKGDPKPFEDEGFDQVGYFSWQQIIEMRDQLSPNMKNLLRAYEDKKLKLEPPQP